MRLSELSIAVGTHAPHVVGASATDPSAQRAARTTSSHHGALPGVSDAARTSTAPQDVLEISSAAHAELDDHEPGKRSLRPEDEQPAHESNALADAESGQSEEEASAVDGELSEEEQEVVDNLKDRDREVRAHELAHLAAAGPYARGGPTFTYERGPDGQNYAIGGEVSIDTSPIPGDPEATIRKAQVVRAAANAPAEPSSQDRAVAAAASQVEAQARQELREQQQYEKSAGDSDSQPLLKTTTTATHAADATILDVLA